MDALIGLVDRARENWKGAIGQTRARERVHRELSALCTQACDEILFELAGGSPTYARLVEELRRPDSYLVAAWRTLRSPELL